MNLLIDALPHKVAIDDVDYEINTDYRYAVMFEMLMLDDSVKDTDKLRQALRLFYGDIQPSDLSKAVDMIMWFYSCGKERRGRGNGRNNWKNDRIYDFDFDDAYIYAAFLQQYGVDLQDEDIHWWKFSAMFQSLSDDTEIVKIMGYRSIKITSDMTDSQKDFYQTMKRIHALPVPKSEAEKIKSIEDALLNGGDVAALLTGR